MNYVLPFEFFLMIENSDWIPKARSGIREEYEKTGTWNQMVCQIGSWTASRQF